MSIKELEQLVLQQGEKIVALGEAVEALNGQVMRLANLIGADEDDGPLYPEFKDLRATIEGLREKVEGRNKSAPVKRNMTDQDALDVLTGAYKDMSHKDAAEQIGLTYAQVYSCRLEFTFKHVHKDLRDAKWVNPWVK
jgi:hypothetical protein